MTALPLTSTIFTYTLGVMGGISALGLFGLMIWAKVAVIRGFLDAFRPRSDDASTTNS